ncbi:unnamed protein product [Arctia plantaginis]|uniref:Uncharacterized protein n=1 Tax=Arctia plantaginis TaxID=874455 RepID=A0A8S0YTP6_ARCPL|nr:unnamed protein product [Arctia plantaginis]CAB3257700.1 unnamed protein product [Arctia plantaginis]
MSKEDELHTSLAHIILCAVAGKSLSRASGKSFTHPGMHANFLIHGVIGFFHYQSNAFNNDFTELYKISLKASKYLAIPCLMADLYHSDQTLRSVHLLSGVVPFVLALTKNDNEPLGHLLVACNVVSLCYYANEKKSEWGWYTAGAAVLAYFVTTQMAPYYQKITYPLALALMEYCAMKIPQVTFNPVVELVS